MRWFFAPHSTGSVSRNRARLEVEHLQERVLPSTSPLPAHHPEASHSVSEHGKAHNHFSFALTGSVKGRAEVDVVNGNLTKLAVHVHGAQPNQKLSVFVDNASDAVGSFKTNAGGSGKLAVKGLSVAVHTGSVLKVEDASGNVVSQGTFHLPGHKHS